MFDATVEVTMAARLPTVKFNCLPNIPSSSSSSKKRVGLKPAFCSAVQQVEQQESKVGILCEPCNGTGWLLCDFCNGQKTNVKSQTNKIYRRCPTCKAIGYILCTKCKVFKCVTFPDQSDGEQLSF
ncbi:Chaperone protein DnaJ [Bienertia sinuspersici]